MAIALALSLPPPLLFESAASVRSPQKVGRSRQEAEIHEPPPWDKTNLVLKKGVWYVATPENGATRRRTLSTRDLAEAQRRRNLVLAENATHPASWTEYATKHGLLNHVGGKELAIILGCDPDYLACYVGRHPEFPAFRVDGLRRWRFDLAVVNQYLAENPDVRGALQASYESCKRAGAFPADWAATVEGLLERQKNRSGTAHFATAVDDAFMALEITSRTVIRTVQAGIEAAVQGVVLPLGRYGPLGAWKLAANKLALKYRKEI